MSGNFSIPVNAVTATIVSATAGGDVEVTDNTLFQPGAYAWLAKNDGSASMRVLIVARITGNKLKVRKVNNGTEQRPLAPSYGYTDVSAFNATSTINQEAGTAPVSHSNVPRQIP